jgi:hypothetical protein
LPTPPFAEETNTIFFTPGIVLLIGKPCDIEPGFRGSPKGFSWAWTALEQCSRHLDANWAARGTARAMRGKTIFIS